MHKSWSWLLVAVLTSPGLALGQLSWEYIPSCKISDIPNDFRQTSISGSLYITKKFIVAGSELKDDLALPKKLELAENQKSIKSKTSDRLGRFALESLELTTLAEKEALPKKMVFCDAPTEEVWQEDYCSEMVSESPSRLECVTFCNYVYTTDRCNWAM